VLTVQLRPKLSNCEFCAFKKMSFLYLVVDGVGILSVMFGA